MISEVIGWKFNHQPGMCCKEIDGVMTIVKFPGGIPSQSDQDTWTAEYEAQRAIDNSNAQTKKTATTVALSLLSTRGVGVVTREEFDALLDVLEL